MQNRYTGDIGDFGKLGLLRKLSAAGFHIGVNWYLTPDENHNGDGKFVAYLEDEALADCDRELWSGLGKIVKSGDRHVAALEASGLLDAVFASDMLDFRGIPKEKRSVMRNGWHSRAQNILRGCDMVFADPDNGMIVPSAEGKPKSNKYALPCELSEYYRTGASVVYYQHKARQTDDIYSLKHWGMASSGGFSGAVPMGLKFRTVSQRFYFFFLQPHHAEKIHRCVEEMLAGPWSRCFERCEIPR